MPTRLLSQMGSHSLWGDVFFPQVSLRDCYNVSVFLAPSVVGLGFPSPGYSSICVGPGGAGRG